ELVSELLELGALAREAAPREVPDRADEHSDEDRQRDERLRHRRRALAACLRVLAREEVDGAHQSSIPSPIAAVSDGDGRSFPRLRPVLARVSGSPTRTFTPTRFVSSAARPVICAAPPVRMISAMPSESGCSW